MGKGRIFIKRNIRYIKRKLKGLKFFKFYILLYIGDF